MLNINKMILQKTFNGRITHNIFKQFYCQVSLKGTWHLEQLKARSTLKIAGEKCSEFLQGLITNDMNLLNNQKAIYAMFLNTKGRLLYDSIIYKTASDNTFILECDVACLSALEKHIKLYKVRRKIDITSGEYSVWTVFPHNLADGDFKLELSEKCIICADPRLPDFGYRAIVTKDANLINNFNENANICYKTFRYKFGIAEGANELLVGKSFPVEMNCDYLNGVSFNKGCYIGQELTARTHHTGVIRKRLMPVSFVTPPENVSIDDPILDSTSLKSVGKLRGIFGNLGLGLMRVSETLASSTLKVGNTPLKCLKPEWWPKASDQYSLKKHT